MPDIESTLELVLLLKAKRDDEEVLMANYQLSEVVSARAKSVSRCPCTLLQTSSHTHQKSNGLRKTPPPPFFFSEISRARPSLPLFSLGLKATFDTLQSPRTKTLRRVFFSIHARRRPCAGFVSVGRSVGTENRKADFCVWPLVCPFFSE